MSKGRSSTVVSLRINDELYARLLARAQSRGLSLSAYLLWLASRSHHKTNKKGRLPKIAANL
jgi:hypothetical protein